MTRDEMHATVHIPAPARIGLDKALTDRGVPLSLAFSASTMAAQMSTRELRVSVVACVLEGRHADREQQARELLTQYGYLASKEGV